MACLRLDFGAWYDGLPKAQRRLVDLLVTGERPIDAAQAIGVSPGSSVPAARGVARLVAARPGGTMKITAFIEARQGQIVRQILEHCGPWQDPPPNADAPPTTDIPKRQANAEKEQIRRELKTRAERLRSPLKPGA